MNRFVYGAETGLSGYSQNICVCQCEVFENWKGSIRSMIRKFSCHNFRNIDVNELELNRVNILIGPNNSGKTNFIKALTFYSNMIKHASEGGEGTDYLNAVARNGWSHSKNYLAKDDSPVSFEWHMDFGGEPMVYKFAYQVGKEREDFKISLEELSSEVKSQKYPEAFNYFRAHKNRSGYGNISTALKKGKENRRLSFKLNCTESVISQFDKLLLEDVSLYNAKTVRTDINDFVKNIEKSFKSFYSYSSAEFNTSEIRKRVDSRSYDVVLKKDGTNLTNVFNNNKNNSLIWKRAFVDVMKYAMRTLVDIDVIDQRDTLSLHLVEKDKEVELSDVSEGTIKVLLWGILFCAPEKEKYDLLTIDEPEANIHPAWQKVMADIMLESNAYKQCVISTHSPDFLDRFTSSFIQGDVSVYAFDLQGNIRKISYEDIAADLGDWQLGDLYRTQDPALGAWPW